MLTIEIKINGQLIKYIQVVNLSNYEQPLKYFKDNINHYGVNYHDFSSHKVTSFTIKHIPNKGAIKLVKDILKKIKE